MTSETKPVSQMKNLNILNLLTKRAFSLYFCVNYPFKKMFAVFFVLTFTILLCILCTFRLVIIFFSIIFLDSVLSFVLLKQIRRHADTGFFWTPCFYLFHLLRTCYVLTYHSFTYHARITRYIEYITDSRNLASINAEQFSRVCQAGDKKRSDAIKHQESSGNCIIFIVSMLYCPTSLKSKSLQITALEPVLISWPAHCLLIKVPSVQPLSRQSWWITSKSPPFTLLLHLHTDSISFPKQSSCFCLLPFSVLFSTWHRTASASKQLYMR